jgi:CTP:molybdopterin cytidylyltransferase MocA
MKTGRYAVIILAAGYSRRMEQFKPLLPLGEETITDHVIATFRQNDVEVYLVVGWRGHELRAGIKKWDINIIENREYQQGMFSSVKAGIRHLPPATESFFIMPVDIPLVRPATVSRLLIAVREHPGKIIYPVFRKKRGHPPLIPLGLAPAILGWQGDGGLRAALRAQENSAMEVIVPDGNILLDIDTSGDYHAMLRRFRRCGVPTDEECEVILDDICQVPIKTRQHCAKVAEVAVTIGRTLLDSGYEVDLEVIRVAAGLHDIAKGQPKHDAAGGRLLHKMGFGTVGDIVAVHTNLADGESDTSLEAKVVYLADKFVKGDSLVPIDERYRSADSKYGAAPEIEDIIQQRKLRALQVKQELEGIIGCSLEKVIS